MNRTIPVVATTAEKQGNRVTVRVYADNAAGLAAAALTEATLFFGSSGGLRCLPWASRGAAPESPGKYWADIPVEQVPRFLAEPPLFGQVRCATVLGDGDYAPPGETLNADGAVTCPEPSRFVVTRADGDPYYSDAGESCEGHLAETVFLLVDSDPGMTVTVQVRFDPPGPS